MTVAIAKTRKGDKKYGRTSVTNGSDLLHGVTDKRSFAYKRFSEIINQILIDQGGAVSESQLQLIRRFAAEAVIAEQLETNIANGLKIDVQAHSTLTSNLMQLAKQMGINRIAELEEATA